MGREENPRFHVLPSSKYLRRKGQQKKRLGNRKTRQGKRGGLETRIGLQRVFLRRCSA
jgi:hypothetical protein